MPPRRFGCSGVDAHDCRACVVGDPFDGSRVGVQWIALDCDIRESIVHRAASKIDDADPRRMRDGVGPARRVMSLSSSEPT